LSSSSGNPVGVVSDLWRYPIKSFQGQRDRRAFLSPFGFLGDRRCVVVDTEDGQPLRAMKTPLLLAYRATFIDSERGEEVDRVVGLEIGADDYVVKPFGLRELIARINAVMRRTGDGGPADDGPDELRAGPLTVSLRTRRVTMGDDEVHLTPREFDILTMLMADAGAVVSRDDLLRRLWGTTWAVQTKAIDVHVSSLRRKLGDPTWVETVRGVGFRLGVPGA
jgi:hypothetical protein